MVQSASTRPTELAVGAQWVLLLLAAPFFLLPTHPLIGLGFIVVGCAMRRLRPGGWGVPRQLVWPLVLLICALTVAFIPTSDLFHGAAKFWSTIFGPAILG